MADFKGKWEDDMIKNIPGAIRDLEKNILPVIREKANFELLEDMKKGNLDNNSDLNNTMNIPSPSKDKVRTLVRENNVSKPVQGTNESSGDEENYVKYKGASSDDFSSSDNPFEALRNNGNASSSTILIVIASFVIVAMLIVICMTLLGYFNLLP